MRLENGFPQWVMTPRKLIAELVDCENLDVPIVIQTDPEGNSFFFLRGSDDTKILISEQVNRIDVEEGVSAIVLLP